MITLGPILTGLRGTQVTGSIIYTLVTRKWVFFFSSQIGGVFSPRNGGILLISDLGHFPTLKMGVPGHPSVELVIDSVCSHTWDLLSMYVVMTFLTCTRSSVVS
jgi:hypothetical protein